MSQGQMNADQISQITKMLEAGAVKLPKEELQQLCTRFEWIRFADLPFEYKHYKCNYDGSVYLSVQSIVDRANLVTGGYDIINGEPNVNLKQFAVGIPVTMKAKILNDIHVISQYGTNTINMKSGDEEPRKDAIEQAIKSAISDGMKKCSAWFGIASHVFRGDVKSVLSKRNNRKAENPKYVELIEKFKLFEGNYWNGIPLLPDEFRFFYQQMGWTDGIFYSDAYPAATKSNTGKAQQHDQSSNGRNQNANNSSQSSQSSANNNSNSSQQRNGGNGDQSLICIVLAAEIEELPGNRPQWKLKLKDEQGKEFIAYASKQYYKMVDEAGFHVRSHVKIRLVNYKDKNFINAFEVVNRSA